MIVLDVELGIFLTIKNFKNPQLLGNPIACGRRDLILECTMDVVEPHLHNTGLLSVYSAALDTNCTSLLLPRYPWSS